MVFSCVAAIVAAMVAAMVAWLYRRRLQIERQIELQLKYSRENLNFALQSGQMGTWDIHLVDNSVTCSREMLDLWGVSAEEFNNERSVLQSKVHPDDMAPMKKAINHAIANEDVYELEYRILPRPDQVRWVFSRGRCSYAPDSHQPLRFSGIVFDITERKMREEALQQAIQTRDWFLTIAGHELKTPLTSLQLLIQLKQRDLKRSYPEAFTAEKISEMLEKQLEHIQRLTRLVDGLLDVSQITEGRLQLSYSQFDICKLVADVAARFPGVLYADCTSILGEWDAFRLEQVLVNLLTNAVKYGNGKPINISVSQSAEEVQIAVRDRGLGIAQEDQDRIFHRFERAISENEVSGLGLGLYIADTIVQLHGGKIILKSEVGQGSEFTVILPRRQGSKS